MRAVSTIFLFIKNNYKVNQLKHVYRGLKDKCDKSVIVIGSSFPEESCTSSKNPDTIAITSTREALIAHDSNWTMERKQETRQHNGSQNSERMGLIGEKLLGMSNSYFCRLKIGDALCNDNTHPMAY